MSLADTCVNNCIHCHRKNLDSSRPYQHTCTECRAAESELESALYSVVADADLLVEWETLHADDPAAEVIARDSLRESVSRYHTARAEVRRLAGLGLRNSPAPEVAGSTFPRRPSGAGTSSSLAARS